VIKEEIKKMKQIIIRSVLAINEHQRLLSTITQIQIATFASDSLNISELNLDPKRFLVVWL
jgi:hypothetical protein